MNIICICLDTFRADMIGEEKKYSHAQTPNLYRLAQTSPDLPSPFFRRR